MTVTWLRLGIAAIGMLVWAYGYQADDVTIRWIGIGLLAVAVLLRFVAPRRRQPPR
jgi:hypothetical protein